jgi:hypothetical protein
MSDQNPPAPAISDLVAPSGDVLSATATPQPPWTTPLISGALVRISRSNALDKTLVLFQYNPETLTRSLEASYYNKESRDLMAGPAKQTISLKLQLEASDQAWSSLTGVLPPLAGLEMMVNPSALDLVAYKLKLISGSLKAVPPAAPRILFVWGPSRVLPVFIKSMSIKEQMFNSLLTPMTAEVDLSLEVCPIKEASDVDFALLAVNLGIVQTLSVYNTATALLGIAAQALS